MEADFRRQFRGLGAKYLGDEMLFERGLGGVDVE
jgi:hypothetical protein